MKSLFLWGVTLCFLLAVPVSKASPSQDFPKLITYNTLMSLSPAQRRAYIADVRQILADLEANMNRELTPDTTAANELKDVRHRLDLFELLLPQAEAQGTVTGKAIPRVVNEATGKAWSCAQAGANLEFNLAVGTCVVKGNNTEGVCSAGYHYGSVKTNQTGGAIIKGYCIPDDSWNALNSGRRDILASAGGAPSLADFYKSNDRANGDKKVPTDIVLGSLSQDDKALATEGHLSDERARELINQQVPLATLDQREKDAKEADKKKESQKVAGACQPAFKCSDITKEERAKLRTQLKGDVCIAGGNFSQYKGGKPKVGACKTMRNWPSDSNKKLSCSGANKAMCNPFLYCLDGNKKPFCFVPTRSFTAQCEKAAQAVKCDPARIKTLGFQDEWTKLRDEFSVTVGTKCLGKNPAPSDLAFQKFFCSECQAIVDRLYGANFKVVGNGCGVAKADDATGHQKPKKETHGKSPKTIK